MVRDCLILEVSEFEEIDVCLLSGRRDETKSEMVEVCMMMIEGRERELTGAKYGRNEKDSQSRGRRIVGLCEEHERWHWGGDRNANFCCCKW